MSGLHRIFEIENGQRSILLNFLKYLTTIEFHSNDKYGVWMQVSHH